MEIPHLTRQHITMSLGYGGILLFWLSLENNNILFVSLLGAGLAGILTGLTVLRYLGGRTFLPYQWIPSLIILGCVIGFAAVWASLFLMIFKNGWHAHAYPDFPATIIGGMVHRLLPWSVAGGFCGGAAVLWRLAPPI